MSPLRRLSAVPPAPGGYAPVGALNRLITLLAPGDRASDGGPGLPSPGPPTWAFIRALAGQELDRAHQIAQNVSHLVEIMYQLNVAENMTLSFQDGAQQRIFQIHAIEDPDERHERLRLYCAELGQNAGGAQ